MTSPIVVSATCRQNAMPMSSISLAAEDATSFAAWRESRRALRAERRRLRGSAVAPIGEETAALIIHTNSSASDNKADRNDGSSRGAAQRALPTLLCLFVLIVMMCVIVWSAVGSVTARRLRSGCGFRLGPCLGGTGTTPSNATHDDPLP